MINDNALGSLYKQLTTKTQLFSIQGRYEIILADMVGLFLDQMQNAYRKLVDVIT